MGISLLAPLFLAGLLAIAVPVLVHLVHRERKEPLSFPSLMFLRRVPFRSARRQRIRYWLLFLLRAAALVLIATAFARPWLKSPPAVVRSASGGKDIVVLVDRSYSMSARGVWDRALRAASEAIASAAANDRVAVVAFGEQAELLARLDEPRSRAQAAVRIIEPGSDVTRYAPAFKLASTLLTGSRGPAEIVVVTDRQRIGWQNMEQVPVPLNSQVRVIDVHPGAIRNVAVTDVRLAQSTFAGRQRFAPSARLINRGTVPAAVPVELRIGGRVQQARTVQLPAGGATGVSFDPVFAEAANGEVRLAATDDVASDDIAYFTTSSTRAPTVRVVSGSADAAFYFENALLAGTAGEFTVQRATSRFSAADLQNVNVVVFLEAQLPSGSVADRLAEFVRQGGGVVIVSGANRFADHDLLPVSGVAPVDRGDHPTTLVSIDAAHPIFAPFRATGAEQFAAMRITRYARSAAKTGASVIARFHDGAPALVEQRLGRGRIVYWGSSFSRRVGDFVLQPAFVPFTQQLVIHASAGSHVAHSFTVGNVIDVNAFAPSDRDAVVVAPSRQRVRLPPANRARTVRVSEAGIYQIRGTGPGAATIAIAANLDLSESDLTQLPVKSFQDAVTPRESIAAAEATPLPPAEREQEQSLWWYLLLTAFVFLAADTLLGNRISSAWRS